MTSLHTLFAVSAVALVTACASLGEPGAPAPMAAKADEHAAHQPDIAASAPMAAMDDRMKAMREMHDKMAKAKTPSERQALMADHMKAMQDGMQMMKGMGGMGGMGGPGGAAGMGGMTGMPADMAQCHQMMAGRMEMTQTMLEMMTQRIPGPPAPPAAK
jgi:hypothetical protein